MRTKRRTFEEDGVQDYLNAAACHPVLTREQEIEAFQRLENGDESARDDIAAHNLRFVVKIALRYRGLGVPLADLIQEGNIGLLTVIDKFDWRKGFRFSTYAAYYIRQEIQAALHRSGSMIRLPVRKARLLGRINEYMRRELERTGIEPTVGEVALELDVPKDKVEMMLELRHTFTSMESELTDDGLCLKDTMADDAAPMPDEHIEREQTKAAVVDVLEYLSEREREVIKLRYGMNSRGRSYSLRGASKMIGLSQEGVRRVEHRALNKLRRPAISSQVEGLLTA